MVTEFLKSLNRSTGPVNTLVKHIRRGSSDASSNGEQSSTKRAKRNENEKTLICTSEHMHGSQSRSNEQRVSLDASRHNQLYDNYTAITSPSTGEKFKSKARPRRRSRRSAEWSSFRSVSGSRELSPLLPIRQAPISPEVSNVASEVNWENTNAASQMGLQNSRRKHGRETIENKSSQPHVKRPKLHGSFHSIDESEDELQGEAPRKLQRVRRTNFSSVGIPSHSPRLRGDITRTAFKSGESSSIREPETRLALKAAASGKFYFDDENPVLLLHEPRHGAHLKPISSNGTAIDFLWLHIDIHQIREVQHAATRSPYVIIHRSRDANSPPNLALKFETVEAATKLVHMLDLRVTKECEVTRLEKIFNHARTATESFNLTYRKTTNGTLPQVRTVSEKFESLENVLPRTSPGILSTLETKQKSRNNHGNNNHSEKFLHDADDLKKSPHSIRLETRRTRAARAGVPHREHSLDRWTEQHREWERFWIKSLVYPALGKDRATVDKEDIPRLNEGEFLNDNLISFYLRYLQVRMGSENPEIQKKVHIFNTFFFEKLRSSKGRINYEGVKSWTSKIDLFAYDYIVVPVNENAHWYIAIICNVSKTIGPPLNGDGKDIESGDNQHESRVSGSPATATVERELSDFSLSDSVPRRTTRQQSTNSIASPRRFVVPDSPYIRERKSSTPQRADPTQPRILTLDSLGSSHTVTCKALREYLIEEARNKKGVELTQIPSGLTAKGIPEQNNYCDCGVFVLGYMEEFLKNPDNTAHKLLMKQDLGWSIDASQLRDTIRTILLDLQREQVDRLSKESRRKSTDIQARRKQYRRAFGTSSDSLSVTSGVAEEENNSNDRGKLSTTELPEGETNSPERSVIPSHNKEQESMDEILANRPGEKSTLSLGDGLNTLGRTPRLEGLSARVSLVEGVLETHLLAKNTRNDRHSVETQYHQEPRFVKRLSTSPLRADLEGARPRSLSDSSNTVEVPNNKSEEVGKQSPSNKAGELLILNLMTSLEDGDEIGGRAAKYDGIHRSMSVD